jgi:hypothetical protein
MRTIVQLLTGVLGLVPAAMLATENAVILESFENNIDSAALGSASPRSDGVALSHYTATDTNDVNVTDGKKSLQINLSSADGWVHDFNVTLSDDASAKVRAAAKSPDVARYILRWDYVFPGGTSWMNCQTTFGNNNDQLESPSGANGGLRTMSIALDLVTNIPEDGPVTIQFADNFAATESPFVGPLIVHLDKIRLVDTYAPGAKAVTYLIQSFENANDPTGGAMDWTGGRTTYTQYKSTGPDDIRVSDGTHALQVDYTGAGTWKQDFKLPFQGTKLAEVLKLDLPQEQRPAPADLARYTFRFDVTYPDQVAGKPSWENTGYDTGAGGFPWSQSRIGGATGQRQTVSITLDQVAWGDSGGQGFPTLGFIANSDWADTGSTLYYDNFRLIDTGVAGTVAPEIKITSFQYDAKTSSVTLRWSSAAGHNYAVDYTQNLGSWPTVLAPSVPGVQGTTTYTGTVPSGARGFMRVRPTN